MEDFMKHFKDKSEAERDWLKELFECVSGQQLCAEERVCDTCVCLVTRIQETIGAHAHTLPLSYRLLPVSELVARQHVPCVSNLSWGTNQHRAWVREAESLTLANCKALSRVNLLLIGCLRERQGREWRLTDGSGAVRCECVSFSPLWLNHAFFLPHWNYIPHNTPQHNQEEAGGYLELIGSPLPLLSDHEGGLPVQPRGVELSGAVGVREATECLSNRQRGLRLHVKGTVRSLLPLLVICGNSFFILKLTDDTNTHTLSVLVTESSCLWWRDCLSVDQSVCVSALRVCALRSWRGNRILCTTDRSALHIVSPDAHVHTQHTHANNTHNTYVEDSLSLVELGLDQCDTATHTDTQTDTQMDTDTQDAPAMPNIVDASEEAGPESVQSAVRVKQSKVISYQGVVTEVVNEGAGLYVIDGKVGLCLAFQPTLRRSLRQGDTIELYDVHFLYRPCPDSSPSMLCACLRTSLKVTTFSRSTGSAVTGNRDDGALPRLLLEKNLTVAQYLWLSHVTNQLRDSLVPTLMREGRVCVMSHCLLECVWSGEREKRRDIYEEMLNEPHRCLLSQYCVYGSVCECVSVSRCVSLFQSEGVSLVPPAGASSLCQTELNAALSWSHRTAQANRRQRPLVLVGVLDLPTRAHCSEEHTQPRTQHTLTDSSQHTPSRTHCSHHTLCLRDQTGAVACVVTETSHDDDDDDDEGIQRAVFNTAWIGSMVCVQKFTVVTEQFLQSDFPSVRHLNNNKYIKHTHYRVYLQFSLDDVHILNPSVAMATHILHAGERRSRGGEKRRREEHKEPGGKRRKMEAGGGQKEEQVKVKNPGEEEGMTTASAQPTPPTATLSAQLPGRTASAQPTPTTATPSAQLPGRTASAQPTPPTATPSAQLPGRTASAQPTPPTATLSAQLPGRTASAHSTPTTATPSAQLPGNNRPCPSVSVVIRMDEKEGVAWKNAAVGSGAEGAGLCLGFSVGAAAIGPVVGWEWNPRNGPMTEREWARDTNRKVVLVFSGQCVQWFPVLQPDCCYRLVVTDTQDSSVLIGSSVVERRGVELHTSPSLLVRSDWKFYSLTRPLLMSPYHQRRPSRVMSVSDVLDCSPVDVVCFQGFVSQRNSLYDNQTRNKGLTQTHTEGLSVRLTLCDQSGRSLQVYLDLSHTPYPPGLLPGNTLLLSGFQRKVSRTGNVYCKSLPVSSVTVISLGDISSPQAPPSPPTMHLGQWGLQCGENRGIVGTVRGHVVCVLSLQLQWACSVCGSVYTKSCSRSQCFSNSSVFKGQAKCVVEDGTGEGQVWFASEQLQRLLALDDSQWEGLQRALRVRGLLRIYTSGRGLVCDTDGTDPVLQYVVCLCSSNAVCRLVSLTCKTNTHSRTSEETLKRFSRGERDFMTRMNPPLQLTCISILTE